MPSRPYDPHPPGGYRKPKLDGLFDDKTPPLKIKRTRGAGPTIGVLRKKWKPSGSERQEDGR